MKEHYVVIGFDKNAIDPVEIARCDGIFESLDRAKEVMIEFAANDGIDLKFYNRDQQKIESFDHTRGYYIQCLFVRN